MEIITGQAVADKCDYSFGDHAMVWNKHLFGTYATANAHNQQFLDKCKEFEGKVMTLFIDNIRLYARPVHTDTSNDDVFVERIMAKNDLLKLCSLLPNNQFIIFTGEEDTPIDEHITLPPNVLMVYAVNALYNTDRIAPFPYGLQRRIGPDPRLDVMLDNVLEDRKVTPNKLLYLNCGIGRNPDRQYLANFSTNDWVTTRFDKDSKFFPYDRYQDFLDEIRDHKFMLCPRGHGMDCHRNWESLYLRRVPVMKDHPYFRRLMKGFPVLFVNDWPEVTRELLESNDHLFQEAQTMDLAKLDLDKMFKSCL